MWSKTKWRKKEEENEELMTIAVTLKAAIVSELEICKHKNDVQRKNEKGEMRVHHKETGRGARDRREMGRNKNRRFVSHTSFCT